MKVSFNFQSEKKLHCATSLQIERATYSKNNVKILFKFCALKDGGDYSRQSIALQHTIV